MKAIAIVLVVSGLLPALAACGLNTAWADPAVGVPVTPQPQRTPDPGGLPALRLNAGDRQAHDLFGYAVALDGDRVVVGAPAQDVLAEDSGGLYVFERRDESWAETAQPVPDELGPGDRLGSAVAMGGEILAAGAPYATVPGAGYAAGAVYVFALENRAWRQHARLTARDGAPFDLFGGALALDGDTLVVGARGADDPSGLRNRGAAYVYRRQGEGWVEEARLSSPGGGADDFFGHSVAVHGDTVAVGAFGEDDPEAGPNAGAVYLFRRHEGAWFLQTRLTSSQPRSQAQFGFAVDFASGDQGPEWLAVGANQYAAEPIDPRYSLACGRVEVFQWQDRTWQPATSLEVEINEMEDAGLIGSAVALGLEAEGRLTLAAGSQFGTSIAIFRGGGQEWERYPRTGPTEFRYAFGSVLDLSGPFLAVGSPWDSEHIGDGEFFREVPQTGAVYVYDLIDLGSAP